MPRRTELCRPGRARSGRQARQGSNAPPAPAAQVRRATLGGRVPERSANFRERGLSCLIPTACSGLACAQISYVGVMIARANVWNTVLNETNVGVTSVVRP